MSSETRAWENGLTPNTTDEIMLAIEQCQRDLKYEAIYGSTASTAHRLRRIAQTARILSAELAALSPVGWAALRDGVKIDPALKRKMSKHSQQGREIRTALALLGKGGEPAANTLESSFDTGEPIEQGSRSALGRSSDLQSVTAEDASPSRLQFRSAKDKFAIAIIGALACSDKELETRICEGKSSLERFLSCVWEQEMKVGQKAPNFDRVARARLEIIGIATGSTEGTPGWKEILREKYGGLETLSPDDVTSIYLPDLREDNSRGESEIIQSTLSESEITDDGNASERGG